MVEPTRVPDDIFLTVQGVRIRYRQQGKGDPVLLIHGLGRSLQDWDDTMDDLSRHYQVIALDLVGSGYSDKPDVPYTLPGLARFILAFMDALQLPRATLVGNSMGAAIALHVAICAPQRMMSLVLVGPVGFGRQVNWALRLCSVPGLGEIFATPSPFGARLTLSSILHDRRLITPPRLQQEMNLSRLPGATQHFLRFTRMMIGPWGVHQAWRKAMLQSLHDLKMPCLVVWGKEDRIVPVAQLEQLSQVLLNAQRVVFDGCGHCPQFEQPARFNTALMAFLKPVENPPN